jgi:hypothetical protein
MGIGTSLGAFYDDEFHYQQSQYDPKRFDTNDDNVVSPNKFQTDKTLDNAELDPSTGMGLEINLSQDPLYTPDTKNLDGLRGNEERARQKLQNSRDEFDKALKESDDNSKKFYLDNTPEMLGPELEQIYSKRYGPRPKDNSNVPMF